MRTWLFALAVLTLAPHASATTWIARSFERILRDADAVVVGEVGDVTATSVQFQVERVLSGTPGRTVMLPVVRCNQPGPDGTTYFVSGCQDRTYRAGERLLLVLVRDERGLREAGHPWHTRYPAPSDAVERAEHLLALPITDAVARAAGIAEMLGDARGDWQRDAAESANPALTQPMGPEPPSVYSLALSRLTNPLRDVLDRGATAQARASAAGALGWSNVESYAVTRSLLDAAAVADDGLAYAAAAALRSRSDPRGADGILALVQSTTNPDRFPSLLDALAPVVRTDHADALARVYRRSGRYESEAALRVWALTGADDAADEAARRYREADRWHRDEALRTLSLSRDRRFADVVLDLLRPVACDEAAVSGVGLEAAPRLAHTDQAVPAVAAYFACDSAYVRWQAVQSLGEIDLPVARAALVAQRRVEGDAEALQAIDEIVGTLQPDER